MNIYLVLPDNGVEGYGTPLGAFSTLELAQTKRDAVFNSWVAGWSEYIHAYHKNDNLQELKESQYIIKAMVLDDSLRS